MAFVKRDVKDRVVQYPRRYQMVEVQPGIFDLIPVTGTIIEPGTPINKAYLQPIEDGLDAALEKTGDGKDVIVTFTEAATEAYIASGEKLSVLFGKILKKIKNVAPLKHDSTANTYGLGTTAYYGHVKTINALTQGSHIDGTALSAYQGKVLNDKFGDKVTLTKLNGHIDVADRHFLTVSKTGNLVNIFGTCKTPSSLSIGLVIATLPAIYRPTSTVEGFASERFAYARPILIRSNGNIEHGATLGGGNDFNFNITYSL